MPAARAARFSSRSQPEPEPRPAPKLAVVGPAALARRRMRQRGRLMIVGAVAIVAGALAIVAGAQGFVAARQVGLDGVEQQLQAAVATNQNLQLERANLASPARVLQIAEQRFGMVVPGHVTYLAPINPGATVIESARKHSR